MDNSNITPELIEKAKGKTAEELLALAQEEGIELTDDQLETISGGWVGRECPECGSMSVGLATVGGKTYACSSCGYAW